MIIFFFEIHTNTFDNAMDGPLDFYTASKHTVEGLTKAAALERALAGLAGRSGIDYCLPWL